MALRPTLLSTLALAALLGGLVFALDRGGCGPVVMVTHTVKTLLTRADPDYDRLEEDRRARAAGRGGPTHAAPDAAGKVEDPTAYWSGYRGPGTAGVYAERALIDPWPDAGPPLAWHQPIGGGWASFAVAGGLAVTIEQRRENEAVVAYDLENGDEVWVHAYAARFSEPLGGEGPRATPLAVDGALVSLGATGELRCLELATGELRWRRNVLGDGSEGNLTYGLAASPVLAAPGAIVILTGAPRSARCVHAFALADGEPLWSALADRGAYATPVLARLAGRDQLVVATASRVVGLAPESGELQWEVPWAVQGGLTISQPLVVEPDRLLLSGGYGAGALMVELEHGADPSVVWRSTRLKTKFNSPVQHAGHAYGLDEGTLVCLDLASGKRLWKGGRYGYGQVLAAGESLLVLAESGELAKVRASPEGFVEEGRVAALAGTSWNVPALADGRLLVRNAVEMACFDLRP